MLHLLWLFIGLFHIGLVHITPGGDTPGGIMSAVSTPVVAAIAAFGHLS
jgi:hypothetical protein